jgi:hypothetical protein
MEPEGLPQEPPGTAARHSTACLASGDHAEARGRICWQPLPVGNQTARGQTFASLAQADELAPVLEAHRAAEPEALGSWGSHQPVHLYWR